MANESTIALRNLAFKYPGSDRLILNEINALIRSGEFLAVIGPNGSGKSTLARLICGLLRPTQGQVLVDGLSSADSRNQIEVRRQVGLVLQNPDNQIVAARVEEDVAFGPENLNLPSTEIHYRVNHALEKVGLGHLKDRPPHLLSGGEKQRLATAGLLALRPAFLILDEPTSMLDPIGRRGVLEVLRGLAAEGTAIVLITHNMDEAVVADRIWVLRSGQLVADGAPGSIFGDPVVSEKLEFELPRVTRLSNALAGYGLNVPAGIVNTDDMVCFLCRLFKQTS
ncbi:energy-coupling factor transport system ATP-binding protein [Desulfotomaculum arcticum]|uniref:Energy-coupling factor transport system ATP-binding protein n=1 Tax=Desulfotruncus arcticus DSM 17038 TaxID=1121424 RepID=A0A1I2W2H9_9FIRM|nr:energy-coupling factor transporter ATPase [Desulfotruncus arcticus]SFG95482.1 energy-coupling factor transport system ATP-binding protein [Desulfotomaculum arcticum] [Desulfotruncus arcticus DSM 17038]